MQVFDKLMSNQENTISLRYLKMYFIGSSGVGKSTTRKRLTRLIWNLASLRHKERERCSTHLAECTQALAMMDENDSKLALKVSSDLDTEIQMLFAYLHHNSSTNSSHTSGGDVEGQTSLLGMLCGKIQGLFSYVWNTLAYLVPTAPQLAAIIPTVPTTPSLEPNRVTTESEQVQADVKVDEVIAEIRSLVGSSDKFYAEDLQNKKILLNLIDIGGQPGFLEMLPFLSRGPGIFLVFFRLDEDLGKLCQVSYEHEETKITPYYTNYTILETLSQILSAINHHVIFDSAIDREFLSKLKSIHSIKPIATLVGTFKDKLELKIKVNVLQQVFPSLHKNDVQKVIEHGSAKSPGLEHLNPEICDKINEELASLSFSKKVEDHLNLELRVKNEAISSITHHFEDILHHPVGEYQFIALDNYTGTDADIDPLRQHLQVTFNNFFKDVELPIRPPHLLLGVTLRKKYDIVSRKNCLRIGWTLSMGEEEVKFSLWYLDRWIGALIYRPEMAQEDKWFEESIICKPQIVFDSISSLIVESLLAFDNQKGNSSGVGFTPAEKKNWLEKGQFSLDTVKRCIPEESNKKMKESKLIPVDKLVIFLKHSSILSLITTKKIQGGMETEEDMCFIPAILSCASPEELAHIPLPDKDSPSPLKLTFKSGYVPIGMFCGIISRLVSRGSTREGILGMRWKLEESGVKRNLVSFEIGSAKHKVTLIAHAHCYEIRAKSCDSYKDSDVHKICSYTLYTVLFVMKEICKLIDPIITFNCQCAKQKESHLCSIHGEDENRVFFRCNHGRITLTRSQDYWFTQVCFVEYV